MKQLAKLKKGDKIRLKEIPIFFTVKKINEKTTSIKIEALIFHPKVTEVEYHEPDGVTR